MRIKRDFVTNSSSANFVLFIESTDFKKSLFVDTFEKFLEEYYFEFDYKFQDERQKTIESIKTSLEKIQGEKTKDKTLFTETYIQTLKNNLKELESKSYFKNLINEKLSRIEQVNNNHFKITDFVSMLNDPVEDCPHYMAFLILKFIQGKGLKFGIKNLYLEIIEDH